MHPNKIASAFIWIHGRLQKKKKTIFDFSDVLFARRAKCPRERDLRAGNLGYKPDAFALEPCENGSCCLVTAPLFPPSKNPHQPLLSPNDSGSRAHNNTFCVSFARYLIRIDGRACGEFAAGIRETFETYLYNAYYYTRTTKSSRQRSREKTYTAVLEIRVDLWPMYIIRYYDRTLRLQHRFCEVCPKSARIFRR